MGKRDLLLIVGFVVIGVIVYQLTAPDAGPDARGRSISAVLDHLRREIRGNPGRAEVTSEHVIPLSSATSELRLEAGSAEIRLVGEDRQDIACELHVRSNGIDEADARRHAEATTLTSAESGGALTIGVEYPPPGSTQWATLRLKVPAQLQVRVQPSRNDLDIGNVAAAELVEARGEVTIKKIAGRVAATHRGGTLTIEDVQALKLNTRGSTVRVHHVEGEATLQIQGGALQGSEIGGPLELEATSARVRLEQLARGRGPIRIRAVAGTVTITGLATEARIDGRNTAIAVALDEPVTLAVFNEGEKAVELTHPPAGFRLDALAIDGRIVLPEGVLDVTVGDNEERALGPVGGGGPTITLRSRRGDIVLRQRESGIASARPTTGG